MTVKGVRLISFPFFRGANSILTETALEKLRLDFVRISFKTNVVISQFTPFIYCNVFGKLLISEKVLRHQKGQSTRGILTGFAFISYLKTKWYQT